jgi:hypothetical protein
MKTRLIIVGVLLFFSLLAMLHFSLPVKGEEDEEPLHHENPPLPPMQTPDPAPLPNVNDSIFDTNNTK